MIRRHPITSFLVLAFGFSWLLGIPFNMVMSPRLGGAGFWSSYVPRMVTVIGPALAAIIVARFGGGAISVSQLLRSLRISSRDLPAVVIIIIGGVAMAMIAFTLAGVPAVEIISKSAPLLAAHFAIQTAVIGIGEELGWRGWLLPTLARDRPFAGAAALTGLAWIVWHGPVLLYGLMLALAFLALLAALSAVFAWLWLRSGGSAGVVAIAHAAVNAPFFLFESKVGGAIVSEAFGYFAALYATLAVVIVVVVMRSRDARV